jgi:hypothetical protein
VTLSEYVTLYAQIREYKKMIIETRLNRLRTACNLPHRFKSCFAYSESLSKEESNSFLFVGRIKITVNGITLTIRIPPISQ